MKKVLILLILTILIAGCSNNNGPLVINDGDIIPNNVCNNLDDIVVVYQTGCSACALALPRIDVVKKELNLDIKFVNLADLEQRKYLEENKFTTLHVPTLIYKCKVYVGAKSTEEYRGILNA
ncbi:MAG: hypothetical protein PHF86_13020 [Candidatus Nanoarchaeia archaeon]|nr:hypothetical protein [Candidatus Nanoarchaeia archaeon]